MDKEFLGRLKGILEELEPQLDAQNAAPRTAPVAPGDTQSNAPKYLSNEDQLALRSSVHKLNDVELWSMFGNQARKRDAGVPVDVWMSAGGRSVYDAMANNPQIAHALDSTGAAALIRQDLEPILYELYIREFPAWTRFSKEPANGLVHAWNQQTGFGDAKFMTELGTVTDDVPAYTRKTAPISILATRRGVSIKGQWGTLAGGAGFNPEQLEMRAGLRAMAHRMQVTIFQGNATVSSGTGTTEDGAYDANAFDGLRKLLSGTGTTNVPVTVDPTSGTPEDMRKAFNDATISAMQLAGNPRVVYIDPIAKGQFDEQQDKNVRYNLPMAEVAPGVMTNAVNTANGALPLFVVPGDSIGSYTHSAKTVSDAYLLDESAISIPYLGSEGPTVLDIPPGISGQLTHIFIVFGMWSLAVKADQFSNKVRIVRP